MPTDTLVRAFDDEFRKTKGMCESAIAQVDDASLHARINPAQNSIAAICQHVAGNLRSRFVDFLTTDGEKPDRDREAEFQDRNLPREQLMAVWEAGWQCLFDAIRPLSDEDLVRIIYIRKEPHTVQKALVRASCHATWHAGQIALIGKHLRGEAWRYLTVPPGGSREYNRQRGL